MKTKLLNAIHDVNSALENLQAIESSDSEILSSIKKLESIQHELNVVNNVLSFDRKTELKALLTIALKSEGLGYDSALECLNDCDIQKVLSRQFNNSYYALLNGERISKDFRVVLYHYLNA